MLRKMRTEKIEREKLLKVCQWGLSRRICGKDIPEGYTGLAGRDVEVCSCCPNTGVIYRLSGQQNIDTEHTSYIPDMSVSATTQTETGKSHGTLKLRGAHNEPLTSAYPELDANGVR